MQNYLNLSQSQGADNSQTKVRLKYMYTSLLLTLNLSLHDQIYNLLLLQCIQHKTKHPNKMVLQVSSLQFYATYTTGVQIET